MNPACLWNSFHSLQNLLIPLNKNEVQQWHSKRFYTNFVSQPIYECNQGLPMIVVDIVVKNKPISRLPNLHCVLEWWVSSPTNFNLQQSFLKLQQEMFKVKMRHSDSENKDLPKYILIINAGFSDQKQLEDKRKCSCKILNCQSAFFCLSFKSI